MTRTIKASEIKPGMEIEWKVGGYYTRCVVGLVQKENLSYPACSIRAVGSAAGWKTFSPGREVTVLKEAQPEEPTTFGARVVVDGVQFVRRGGGSTYAWEASFGTCFTWDDLLRLGHVTVVPDQGWTDPFSPPAQDATEPRKWDRWEDVPEMVPVRAGSITAIFRRNRHRVERLFLHDGWGNSIFTPDDLNMYAHFTEVSDA